MMGELNENVHVSFVGGIYEMHNKTGDILLYATHCVWFALIQYNAIVFSIYH